MKLIVKNFISQNLSGIREYNANCIEDFLENKDVVRHYRNGIEVTFVGNYSMTMHPPEIRVGLVTDLKGVTWQEEEFLMPKCTIEQYPYNGEKIENVVTMPIFIGIFPYERKTSVFNPKIHYKLDDENELFLLHFQKNPPKDNMRDKLVKRLCLE